MLVWAGAYGYDHPSTKNAEAAFMALAEQTGAFTVEVTENPALLNMATLRDVDVLAWINTTGKAPFTRPQKDDIIRWSACGGGNVAFHAAADSDKGWPEHAELLGAQFDSHPKNAGSGAARILVEDGKHPITEPWHGKSSFELDDEYYRWRAATGIPGVSLPRQLPGVDVLLSLDETTVNPAIQSGPMAYERHQPLAWTKTFRGGGRVYYNNMGHSEAIWSTPELRTSIVNGVDWVSDVRADRRCLDSSAALPPAAAPPAPRPATIGRSCPVPVVAPRGGGGGQTSGPARRLTEAGDTQTLDPGVPAGAAWGAQTWVLDLSRSRAARADVTVDLSWPLPVDDYDLSVTTEWGWYGSAEPLGGLGEQIVLRGVPHCAVLQAYGDNMYAFARSTPTVTAAVRPAARFRR